MIGKVNVPVALSGANSIVNSVPPVLDSAAASQDNYVILSTTQTNDLIVVYVGIESEGSLTQVSSIVDGAGLTWHKRSGVTLYPDSSGSYNDAEVWYAISPNPLPDDQITANLNGGVDDMGITAFGVANVDIASPWDPSSALPTTATDPNGNGGTAIVSVSTESTHTMLLGFAGNDAYNQPDSCTGTWQGTNGYTDIATIQNCGGDNAWYDNVAYLIVNSPQISNQINMVETGGDNEYWSMIGDAIRGS
jgi:hypothetical protein